MKGACYFLLIILCGTHQLAHAQSVRVDPLTGKPSMGIPIWTVNSGDLAASIGLSYSGTPKVNDGEGSAGMGWNLMAGGQVSREVRGLPDDYSGALSGITGDIRKGWIYGGKGNTINGFTPVGGLDCGANDITDFNALTSITGSSGYDNDTEPDMFYFSAPGLSGQFIFNKDTARKTIIYRDVKITNTFGTDGLINKIVITNNVGVVYTFTAGDKITRTTASPTSTFPTYFTRQYSYYQCDLGAQKPATFYASWNLASIKSPNGGRLNFTYANDYDTYSYDHVLKVNSSGGVDTLYTITDRVVGKRLSIISGTNEQAAIAWNNNLAASVSIKDLTYQSLVKKFNLTYQSITASKRSKKKPKRSYLVGFSQEVNCASFPGYKFNYYGVYHSKDSTSMPYDTGVGQDIFGYYDSTATSAAPEVYENTSTPGTNGERYRIAPAVSAGYSLISATFGGRTVNSSKVFYGSLKSVTLPSGGVTTVVYEAADYYDALTSSNILGGGPRVDSVKTTGSDVASNVIVTYVYRSSTAPTRSSGQWTYRPMFTASSVGLVTTRVPYNIAPEEVILYSRVEESVTGRGKTVYEFRNAGMYGASSSGDFTSVFSRIARPDPGGGACASLSDSKTGYFTFPYAPNTNYDLERGLPLRVSEYRADGKLVRRKTNTYQRTTLTAEQVYGIRFEIYSGSFQYQKYPVLANADNVSATESTRVYDSDSVSGNYIETISTYSYNSGQMVSQVVSTGSDGVASAQTFKYVKDYANTGTDTQGEKINELSIANRHGTLVETTVSSGGSVTAASLTLFNTFGSAKIFPSHQLVLGDPTGFSNSTVSGSAFSFAPKYDTMLTIDVYDSLGRPIMSHDRSRTFRSVMMGYRSSLPALEINNGRYNELIYTDFEPYQTLSAYFNAPATTSEYWSGKYSFLLTGSATTSVTQTGVLRATSKKYKFSCWTKGASAATLTVKINGTSFGTAPYPSIGSAGGWQYVEKVIDMTSITAGTSFGFALTSSGDVYVDNVAFYPISAEIIAHAYEPLNGKTADLDGRGNAGFQDYDALGRLRYVKNQDKDVVKITDYNYKSATSSVTNSHFTFAAPIMLSPTTFTADASCMGGVGYAWYVDGAAQSSTTGVMTYSGFNANKDYFIKLVATSSTGSSTTVVKVHPQPYVSITAVVTSGESTTFNCRDATFLRHITITVSGCFDNAKTYFQWSRGTIACASPLTLLGSCYPHCGNCYAAQSATNVYTVEVELLQGSTNTFDFWVYTQCKDVSPGGDGAAYNGATSSKITKTFNWQVVSPC